jgi:copper(I)-binding protein
LEFILNTFVRRTVFSALTAATLTLSTIGISQAATIKAGQTCGFPGAVHTSNKLTYICNQSGSTLTWSKPLPVGKFTLTAKDTWAKAATSGNTAVFGFISNPTNKPITIVAGISPVAPVTQLHEVVMKNGAMAMQQKPGGFVIPANGTLELKPGGDHVMLLGLTKPISAGDQVPVTLISSTGARYTFTSMAKVFLGGNESYKPGSMASQMPSMKM